MGEVMLGLPGPWAEDYREKADHYTTKIGGIPDWPSEGFVGVRPELLRCSLCGGKLCLVAQVYAPISMPKLNIEERVIYILGCPMPQCGNNPQSWRALRVQKCRSDAQKGDVCQKSGQLEKEFGPLKEDSCSNELLPRSLPREHSDESGGDDGDDDLDDLAKALEQATTLASQSKKQNELKRIYATTKGSVAKQRISDPTIPVLPCFYIYCEKERSTEQGTTTSNGSHLVLIKEIEDNAGDQEEKWEGESYEYDRALGVDRTFLKFKKRLDAYPEQCIRYSYGGNPLLAAMNLPEPGTCKHCGSLRQYELQLMPPLLYFLHEAAEGSKYSPDGWTWMTLFSYTCSKSCCPPPCGEKPGSCCWGVSEEEIIIQED